MLSILTQVPERDVILRLETVSAVDTDPEQIATVRLCFGCVWNDSWVDRSIDGWVAGLTDTYAMLPYSHTCIPQQLLKALALDALKTSQVRKAAEAAALKQQQEAAAAKACCTIA